MGDLHPASDNHFMAIKYYPDSENPRRWGGHEVGDGFFVAVAPPQGPPPQVTPRRRGTLRG